MIMFSDALSTFLYHNTIKTNHNTTVYLSSTMDCVLELKTDKIKALWKFHSFPRKNARKRHERRRNTSLHGPLVGSAPSRIVLGHTRVEASLCRIPSPGCTPGAPGKDLSVFHSTGLCCNALCHQEVLGQITVSLVKLKFFLINFFLNFNLPFS